MFVVLLVLSFLVIIHELGHYFVARWRGVKVEEFGIGYPPRALKLFTWKHTLFSLNWIPFGGFVRMSGEDATLEEIEAAHSKSVVSKSQQFYSASTVSKLLIIYAGAFVNFIFGILIFSLLFSYQGIPEAVPEARIGEIAPGSPAAQAGIPANVNVIGLKDGDVLVPITDFSSLVSEVAKRAGSTITIVTTGECEGLSCQESVHEYTVRVRTPEEVPAGQGALGVGWGPAFVKYAWYEMPFRSVWYGTRQALYMGGQILSALRQLAVDVATKGRVPQDIAGPVGIVHQAQETGLANQGLTSILFFAGMLSVNLAIMNVLPIPPLDGGRGVFIALGALIRSKTMAKVEYYANYGGYVFLIILIILVTIRDVVRMIG